MTFVSMGMVKVFGGLSQFLFLIVVGCGWTPGALRVGGYRKAIKYRFPRANRSPATDTPLGFWSIWDLVFGVFGIVYFIFEMAYLV